MMDCLTRNVKTVSNSA